jgi:hypothetical protein
MAYSVLSYVDSIHDPICNSQSITFAQKLSKQQRPNLETGRYNRVENMLVIKRISATDNTRELGEKFKPGQKTRQKKK